METPNTPGPPETRSDPAEVPRALGSAWAMPLVLFAALAVASMLLLKFKSPAAAPGAVGAALQANTAGEGWTPAPPADAQTVALKIDFGNGAVREFAAIAWTEGMTVGDLMDAASEFRPGIRLAKQGQGEMTLLTSIDGVANQGPDGRSWIYHVNDEPGQVSYAIQRISAGDRVLWVFSPPE